MSKTDTSTQYFETKLSQDPESLVFSRLADRYRKNGEIQQAISVCMEGLKSHPDYVTGLVVLGRCYFEQEKLQEAIAEFVKVLELDRRNQVAVKMIADIYSTQGMKEKAGDLYSFLLRMDPDNKSLHRLTSTFRGQGETSIQKILGITGEASEPGAEEEFTVATPSDVIVDADRTIQMDRVFTQPEIRTQDNADFGEMLVKTQEFDATELGASAERAEELSVDTSDKQGGVVTGDDISSRMDTLFGEAETPTAATEDAKDIGVDTSEKHGGGVTGDDISSRMDTLFAGGETPAAAVEPETLEHVDIGMEHSMDHTETSAQTRTDGKDDWVVSGSDISSRLEQLFSQEKKTEITEEVGPEADFTQAFETQEIAGDTRLPAPKTSLSAAPIKELGRDELRPVESSDLSGEDITSRLNEMFDEAPAAEPLGQDTDVGGKPAVEIEETPVFDVASDTTAKSMTGATEETAVAGAGKSSAAEPQGQDTDVTSVPAVEMEETPVFDVATDIPATSMTDATEEIAIPGAGKAPAAPADEVGISGDDVAFRLETILGEGEGEAAGSDVAGTDVIPADEIDKPRSEEETKHPLNTGERAIVVGDEDEGNEAASETIVIPAAKRPAKKTGGQDKKPAAAAPAIDDMEEEDASPSMSGDDVAGRLEEIFNESPFKDDDLKPAEAVPVSDKEDESVTQAFHPRSGENAQAAESDETMLSDLDQSEDTMLSEPGKVEDAAPEAETLDMAREPEEKTVLMDEDDSEDTMITEEETIISGARDPFLPTPPRAHAKIDEREKDETARAAAPSPRHDAVSNKEPREEPDAEQTQAYSIPDHVLTPTLADIYYQQGQPQLALQIYRRLLSADPDNERMAQRIAEIERGLATQEADETVAMEHARKKAGVPSAPVASGPKEKKPKKSAGPRPLAGVRIKRKFKAKRKKLK